MGAVTDNTSEARQRISLDLRRELVAHLDGLKKEWGIRSRGDVLERLLEQIFAPEDDDSSPQPASAEGGDHRVEDDLDEQGALVLVGRGALETLQAEFQWDTEPAAPPPPGRSAGGIDLPGFVRRRSDSIKRSLRPPSPAASGAVPLAPLPLLTGETVQQAMEEAGSHWLGLYGKAANDTVLEAAMAWLAHDIWPQSDQSDGRAFTWTAACQVMQQFVPGWSDGPPSFERVMVTAGVLEDPFSGPTLTLRIPTLIRRFVHRFRRRPRGTSFQTLEHTMTLHGALRLLQLPTDPGHRLTLAQIREAYRDMAQSHHPDAGGSVEVMRRLNEAYQLLKELYRHGSGAGR